MARAHQHLMVHLYRIKPLHEALTLCLRLPNCLYLSLREVGTEFMFTAGQYLVTIVADTNSKASKSLCDTLSFGDQEQTKDKCLLKFVTSMVFLMSARWKHKFKIIEFYRLDFTFGFCISVVFILSVYS